MIPVYAALALLQSGTNALLGPIFMYGAIFAIFYFVLIRPGQRQRKAQESQQDAGHGVEAGCPAKLAGYGTQSPGVFKGWPFPCVRAPWYAPAHS